MQRRQNALHEWLKIQLKSVNYTAKLLAGDASFRRYFRVFFENQSYVLMDAPPEKEAIKPFLDVTDIMTNLGITVPYVHAFDQTQGFILLEDLGDELLLNVVTMNNANALYHQAIDILINLQRYPISTSSRPEFSSQVMQEELNLFPTWFLTSFCKLTLDHFEKQMLVNTFKGLISEINALPQALIHRDYHSRNILVLPNNTLGVIDYQDAMIGPMTYDLVSLLKDCYIEWPYLMVEPWKRYYYDRCAYQHKLSYEQFSRAVDVCGIQRHLKVLGIFCRLHLRDNKSNYLNDLPLTLNYLSTTLPLYEEFNAFTTFFQERVIPQFHKKHSSCIPL